MNMLERREHILQDMSDYETFEITDEQSWKVSKAIRLISSNTIIVTYLQTIDSNNRKEFDGKDVN